MWVRRGRNVAGLALASALTFAVAVAPAASRTVVDTFTATTANMTPAGLELRVQILEWSTADARATVVATLASEGGAASELVQLPTVGYLWPTGSPVGYSLKYAHRAPLPTGGERITLVADKRVGSYDFKGWSVNGVAPKPEIAYSVIELYLDAAGNGVGTSSLAADVVIDDASNTVSLATGGATVNVLEDVKRNPGTA
jgi:hypothetical protein